MAMSGEEESKLFQYGGRSLQRGRHVVSKSDTIKLSAGQHCFPLVTGAGKIEAYAFQMRKSRKVSAILGTTGQSGSISWGTGDTHARETAVGQAGLLCLDDSAFGKHAPPPRLSLSLTQCP